LSAVPAAFSGEETRTTEDHLLVFSFATHPNTHQISKEEKKKRKKKKEKEKEKKTLHSLHSYITQNDGWLCGWLAGRIFWTIYL
jgi:hypothetical protein